MASTFTKLLWYLIKNGAPVPPPPPVQRYVYAVSSDATKWPMKIENLFDKATMGSNRGVSLANTYGDDKIWYAGSGSTSFAVQIEPKTTYTIYCAEDVGGTIFRAATTERLLTSEDGSSNPYTPSAIVRKTTNVPLTITSGANDAYLYVQYSSTVFEACKGVCVIVKGSTAPAQYVPYGSWKFVKDTQSPNLFDRPNGSHSSSEKGSVSASAQVITANYQWSSAWSIYKLSGTINSNSIAASIAQMRSQSGTDVLFRAGKTYVVKLFDSTTDYYDLQIANATTNMQIRDGVAFTPTADFNDLWVRTQEGSQTAGDHTFKVMISEGSTVPTSYVSPWGYYNESTEEYVGAVGATGTVLQAVSYLESDGTQYINTGIIPTTFDYTITCECAIESLSGGPNCMWGYMMGSSGLIPRWMCGTYSSRFLMSPNTTEQVEGSADTDNHTFVSKVYESSGTAKWSNEIDGALKQDKALSNPDSWSTNEFSIYVFARHVVGGSGAGGYAKATMKRWICEKNGAAIMHLIPVRVGTTGYMMDLVGWKLYANAGTGAFTYGEDIPWPTPQPPVLLMMAPPRPVLQLEPEEPEVEPAPDPEEPESEEGGEADGMQEIQEGQEG